MQVGKNIEIETSHNDAIVTYYGRQVGGIKSFAYILAPGNITKSCELHPLLDEHENAIQKDFAAELVKFGFNIRWVSTGTEGFDINYPRITTGDYTYSTPNIYINRDYGTEFRIIGTSDGTMTLGNGTSYTVTLATNNLNTNSD